MLKHILFTVCALVLLVPSFSQAEGVSGCAPEFRALAENAVVELKGTGDQDIVILTDPLCWHCRLAHKLLGEYPDLYRSMKISFFPRRSFIGSDMAAWIIEDAVGTDSLKAKMDFAYKHLRQPKTDDLNEARDVVLAQFVVFFPEMLGTGSVDDLAVRLKKDNEAHVLQSAALASAAKMPGTPVLIAGKKVIVGYGPEAWLKALEEKVVCE